MQKLAIVPEKYFAEKKKCRLAYSANTGRSIFCQTVISHALFLSCSQDVLYKLKMKMV